MRLFELQGFSEGHAICPSSLPGAGHGREVWMALVIRGKAVNLSELWLLLQKRKDPSELVQGPNETPHTEASSAQ